MVFLRQMLHTARRIPMIKFRKGGPYLDSTAPGHQSAAAAGAPGSTSTRSVSSGETIEEWQLPARYQRKPIDDVEMEWINNGGPPA
ncbi:alpha-ketoglutarate dehydrogenase component 4 [Wyeomyia smithii]|uniref:alpha-ketoglutarate dehydrogenase component 4 n=1 Tax=Wyeomyia smithii TaxID=174621 RepID=UPI002467DEC0|nr:alpha-ketoglutarate dehydrogenase component 4 [Wyeomyia smithii]